MKKLLAFILIIITIFLSGCSQESKFGLEQFTTRMNKQFDTDFETNDFLLCTEDDNNYLLFKEDKYLLTLSLSENNRIKGFSLMLTGDLDIKTGIDMYCQMCSVFTGNDYTEQKKILSDCKITSDNIKYADSNLVITIGRYKYTIVCNTYSVTLFCDRI